MVKHAHIHIHIHMPILMSVAMSLYDIRYVLHITVRFPKLSYNCTECRLLRDSMD